MSQSPEQDNREISGDRRELLRRWMSGAGPSAARPRNTAVEHVPVDGPVPASPAQEALWFLEQMHPGNPRYNMGMALRLHGRPDTEALAEALAGLVRRHGALRTCFRTIDGRPHQVVREDVHAPLVREDLTGADEDTLHKRLTEEFAEPFDLGRAPLVRFHLFTLAEDAHVLALTVHHTVGDGDSLGLLVRELGEHYGALAGGSGSEPEAPALTYTDYSRWQRERLESGLADTQLEFWRSRLDADAEPLPLPTDRPRPQVSTHRGVSASVDLGPETSEALAALAREHGATPFTAVMALLAALLHRYTERTDVVVGTAVNGRGTAGLERIVGYLVNTLAVRCDVDPGSGFAGLLGAVRTAFTDALRHQDVPFERVVAEVGPERAADANPLFNVLLVRQETGGGALTLGGLDAEPVPMGASVAQFDLTVHCSEEDGNTALTLVGDADQFDGATLRLICAHLAALAGDAVARTDTPLTELAPVGPDHGGRHEGEHGAAPGPYRSVEGNGVEGAGAVAGGSAGVESAGAEVPAGTERAEATAGAEEATVWGLFEAQARRTPDAVAVRDGAVEVDFARLHAAARGVGRRLAGTGVGAGDRVDPGRVPSWKRTAALLGALSVGAVVDPGNPDARPVPAERTTERAADTEGQGSGTAGAADTTDAADAVGVPEVSGSGLSAADADGARTTGAEDVRVTGADGASATNAPTADAPAWRTPAGEAAQGELAHTLLTMAHGLGVGPGSGVLATPAAEPFSTLLPLVCGATLDTAGADTAILVGSELAALLDGPDHGPGHGSGKGRKPVRLPSTAVCVGGPLTRALAEAAGRADVRALALYSPPETPGTGLLCAVPDRIEPTGGHTVAVVDARGRELPVGVPGRVRVARRAHAAGHTSAVPAGGPRSAAATGTGAVDGRAAAPSLGDRGRTTHDGSVRLLAPEPGTAWVDARRVDLRALEEGLSGAASWCRVRAVPTVAGAREVLVSAVPAPGGDEGALRAAATRARAWRLGLRQDREPAPARMATTSSLSSPAATKNPRARAHGASRPRPHVRGGTGPGYRAACRYPGARSHRGPSPGTPASPLSVSTGTPCPTTRPDRGHEPRRGTAARHRPGPR